LRYAAGAPTVDRSYPWGAFWCLVPDPERRWSGTLHQRYDGPRRMAGILPVGTLPTDPGGPPKVSFFWSVRADGFEAWLERGIGSWHDEMRAYWPDAEPVWGAIRDPAQLARATYRDVVFRSSVAPGLAVIGDAAHAMSPQLGQGANLALVDALFLGEALAGARADTVDGALRRYDRARRGHVRFYQRASRWLTPMFQSERRFAGLLRDWSFPLVQRLPVLRSEAGAVLAGTKRGWLRRIDPDRWRRP
ncbi:MAG: NAD(P)/FAD-dependent oxidoreductase, partial [Bauldia litoralis]